MNEEHDVGEKMTAVLLVFWRQSATDWLMNFTMIDGRVDIKENISGFRQGNTCTYFLATCILMTVS